ncbi:hypothetical protein EDB85DRAFT_1879032, partial [Lactarius pseudohatsudake]
VECSAVLKALLAWVDRGVLREETEDVDVQRCRLLKRVPDDVGAGPVGIMTAGSRMALVEEEPAMLTVQQQQAEQMKVYWKFIEGTLTNLGWLLIDLKFTQGYDRTVDQLGMFMNAARREGLVSVKDER